MYINQTITFTAASKPIVFVRQRDSEIISVYTVTEVWKFPKCGLTHAMANVGLIEFRVFFIDNFAFDLEKQLKYQIVLFVYFEGFDHVTSHQWFVHWCDDTRT